MTKTQGNWRTRTILFFASQCITLFGSQIVQMAIIWYVTLQTNSGAWVAAFSICAYFPQFFVSFIGGVWADRYHKKHLIIGADALENASKHDLADNSKRNSPHPFFVGGDFVFIFMIAAKEFTFSAGGWGRSQWGWEWDAPCEPPWPE